MCIHMQTVYVYFKQKPADQVRISDWSSDVCSSDLSVSFPAIGLLPDPGGSTVRQGATGQGRKTAALPTPRAFSNRLNSCRVDGPASPHRSRVLQGFGRSEEHTSELQSLMRISYAVFCLKKKKKKEHTSI